MLIDEAVDYGLERITAQVKLVIWDLDDTFWHGTLSEGPVSYVPEHIALVKTLAERGIISAICSKNEYGAAREALIACDVWDYFVFNKIDFSPKGARVGAIIEEMNLRAVNVLFIDDNPLNLREAAYAAPGVMVAHPDAVLPGLLENSHLKGKPDQELKRLNQYRQLQQKVVDQSQNTLSNEAFLRQCEIRVDLIYDLDPHIDRLIDLINRSNQLNYTKKRVDEKDRERFIAQLSQREVYAGAVSVADRYGDYGIVGFFLHVKDPVSPRLEQFVFSCRIMNMGVEQFVYDHLGRPPFETVPPVAYPFVIFENVDWISIGSAQAQAGETSSDDKLLLIGGCDLLQVASYCSRRRAEFVNDVRNDVIIRYDDFGFILNEREKLANSRTLPKIPCWTAEEALNLDAELEQSDVLVISLWVALRGRYFVTDDQIAVRVHPFGLGEYLDAGHKNLLKNGGVYNLLSEQNEMLLKASILALAARTPRAHSRIMLGANTRKVDASISQEDRDQRILYNKVCESLSETHQGFDFVGIDALVPLNQMVDDWHYTRMGYLIVAEEVKRRIALGKALGSSTITAPDISVCEVVKQGRAVPSFALLGPEGYGPNPVKNRVRHFLKSTRAGRFAVNAARATAKRTGALLASQP